MDNIKKKAYREGFADGAFISFIGFGCLFLYFSKKVIDLLKQTTDIINKELKQTNNENDDGSSDSSDNLENLP